MYALVDVMRRELGHSGPAQAWVIELCAKRSKTALTTSKSSSPLRHAYLYTETIRAFEDRSPKRIQLCAIRLEPECDF